MKISRKDMRKLRNVQIEENLETILKDMGIEVEPKLLLPDITPGRYFPEQMPHGSKLWYVKSDAKEGTHASYMRQADAILYAAASRMALAMKQILDLGILGDVPKRMFERILRDAGADI